MLKVRGEKTHSFLQSSETSQPISNKNWGSLESCHAYSGLLRKKLRRFQYFVGAFSNFVGDNFYFVGGNFCFVGEKNKEIGQNIAQIRLYLAFLELKSHIHRIFLQKYWFSPHFLSL